MDTDTVSGSGPRAGVREWIRLAVLALPTLLIAWKSERCFWRCRT